MTVSKLATSDPGAPFAVSGQETVAVVSGAAVRIVNLKDGAVRDLAPVAPVALSFSPDGERLAIATFAKPTASSLRIYDLQGKLLHEAEVGGRITRIIWRNDGELLAPALTIKKFTFGSEIISQLHRWDGTTPPKTELINDLTVKRKTGAWPAEMLYRTFSVDLSPYGDEIAYRTLKDPPLFPPYLSICIRHLETGKGGEVATTPTESDGPYYAPDGERVVVGSSQGLTRWIRLSDGNAVESYLASSVNIAVSPSAKLLLLDGQLFDGDKKIASFAPEVTGAFLPDGKRLLVSYQGALYLVSGLKDGPVPALPKDRERLLKLRRLRSMGLITQDEFKKEPD
jgi:WD40 repeat protein